MAADISLLPYIERLYSFAFAVPICLDSLENRPFPKPRNELKAAGQQPRYGGSSTSADVKNVRQSVTNP